MSMQAWRQAVAEGATTLGYAEWVNNTPPSRTVTFINGVVGKVTVEDGRVTSYAVDFTEMDDGDAFIGDTPYDHLDDQRTDDLYNDAINTLAHTPQKGFTIRVDDDGTYHLLID